MNKHCCKLNWGYKLVFCQPQLDETCHCFSPTCRPTLLIPPTLTSSSIAASLLSIRQNTAVASVSAAQRLSVMTSSKGTGPEVTGDRNRSQWNTSRRQRRQVDRRQSICTSFKKKKTPSCFFINGNVCSDDSIVGTSWFLYTNLSLLNSMIGPIRWYAMRNVTIRPTYDWAPESSKLFRELWVSIVHLWTRCSLCKIW